MGTRCYPDRSLKVVLIGFCTFIWVLFSYLGERLLSCTDFIKLRCPSPSVRRLCSSQPVEDTRVSSPTDNQHRQVETQVCGVPISTPARAKRGSRVVRVCVHVTETTGADGFVYVCLAGLRGCRTRQSSVGSESI